MELVGGNEVKLSPATTANMSYVFPNKVKCNNNLLAIINFVLSLHFSFPIIYGVSYNFFFIDTVSNG